MQKSSWLTDPLDPNSFAKTVVVDDSIEKSARLAGLKVKYRLLQEVAKQIRDEIDREILKDLLAIHAASNP